MQIRPWIISGLLLLIGLVGCDGLEAEATPDTPLPREANALPTEVLTPETPRPEPTNTLSPGPTQPPATPTNLPTAQVCSPVEGIPLSGLEAIVYNPYFPPLPGSDDPHQGVDFAYTLPDTGIGLSGRPVFNVLPGRVAGVIRDRFPYGNAVIIETALDDLPDIPGWQPPDKVEPQVSITLTCPDVELTMPDGEGRSLYSLYAHMESPTELGIGDEVVCGDALGATGETGNALHPHLHLEMRVGPAGARFESMAHYETRASDVEMASYCWWRVTGDFALVDPMMVLLAGEKSD